MGGEGARQALADRPGTVGAGTAAEHAAGEE
ncbi:hypothetical protein SAMN05216259_10463 [Actinacidiphila guanduensis]|uniref:Uncharacterized protein n=1 Tax=Actinacidiphila guanduensis TaxID=310781 RepID=A0A1H0B5X1_9ACTN|nr:hypothetical protein SAMN05216259_10463 [Actinacidiphila guanduensis]